MERVSVSDSTIGKRGFNVNDLVNQDNIPDRFPTDPAGFEQSMIDLFTALGNEGRLSTEAVYSYVEQVNKVASRMRELGQHRLNSRYASHFHPGEAVLYIGKEKAGAGIVVSVSSARVNMHLWWEMRASHRTVSTDPVMQSITPKKIKGIRLRADWSRWCQIMFANGHTAWPPMTQAAVMYGCGFEAIDMVLSRREVGA